MTIKETLNMASEGGWDGSEEMIIFETPFLDPLFWQALGKSLGWIDKKYPDGEMRCENKLGRCESRYCEYAGYKDPVSVWHSLIDHLASGGSIDTFFKELK